jgi:hemoglobin
MRSLSVSHGRYNEDSVSTREFYVPPIDPRQIPPPSREVYAAMGEENIFRMLADFYAELERSSIRAMFPADMRAASEKSAAFFVSVLGGPPLYQERYGNPMMRARHAKFVIDPAARQVWVDCFERVLAGAPARYQFPSEHLEGFKEFLRGFSMWMVNTAPRNVLTWEDVMHFRDVRPPHEIKFQLERDLMTLFTPSWHEARLAFTASPKVNGLHYHFELSFDASLAGTNAYTLRVGVEGSQLSAADRNQHSDSATSWFKHWTRTFTPAEQATHEAGTAGRYQALAEQALSAESGLTDVASLQQAILHGLRQGATFSTAHKEGSTVIRAAGSGFIRSDYGESELTQRFGSDAEFLDLIRKFYDWETSRSVYPEKVAETVAWKLIYRLLRY